MKPQRQENLDEMTNIQLDHKRSDIIWCIDSAKSIESRQWYE